MGGVQHRRAKIQEGQGCSADLHTVNLLDILAHGPRAAHAARACTDALAKTIVAGGLDAWQGDASRVQWIAGGHSAALPR